MKVGTVVNKQIKQQFKNENSFNSDRLVLVAFCDPRRYY